MIISLLSRSTNSSTAPHCRPIAARSLGYDTYVELVPGHISVEFVRPHSSIPILNMAGWEYQFPWANDYDDYLLSTRNLVWQVGIFCVEFYLL
jgi:hypothetical protein